MVGLSVDQRFSIGRQVRSPYRGIIDSPTFVQGVEDVRAAGFLDGATRSIAVEFAVANVKSNVLSYFRYVVEQAAGVVPAVASQVGGLITDEGAKNVAMLKQHAQVCAMEGAGVVVERIEAQGAGIEERADRHHGVQMREVQRLLHGVEKDREGRDAFEVSATSVPDCLCIRHECLTSCAHPPPQGALLRRHEKMLKLLLQQQQQRAASSHYHEMCESDQTGTVR